MNSARKGGDTDTLPSPGTEEIKHPGTGSLFDEPAGNFSVSFTKGQLVGEGRFRIVAELPQKGGQSQLYLGEETAGGKQVIIKLYHQNLKPKDEILRLLVTLRHPGLLGLFSFHMVENQVYEIMEYAEGGSLSERAAVKRFSEDELQKAILPQLVSAVTFLHDRNIIHRDIKPGNMFFREKEQVTVVISDFGISSLLEDGHTDRRTRGLLTPDCAAPELFGYNGEHYASREGDYYALGISLLWLYLGESPFRGLSNLQIMSIHASEKISLPDSLSERFRMLLSGLLVKERKERWMAKEIGRWLNGEDVPVFKDKQRARPAHSPYTLGTESAESPENLARLLQIYPDRDLLKKRWGEKAVSRWLYQFDQNMADKVSDVEEHVSDPELALIQISMILDPLVPYYLSENLFASTAHELARLMDEHRDMGLRHFMSGKIFEWLKNAPGGQDILRRWENVKR